MGERFPVQTTIEDLKSPVLLYGYSQDFTPIPALSPKREGESKSPGARFRLIANPLRCAIISLYPVLCRPASGKASVTPILEESRLQ